MTRGKTVRVESNKALLYFYSHTSQKATCVQYHTIRICAIQEQCMTSQILENDRCATHCAAK